MCDWKGLYIGVYTSEERINTVGVFNAKLWLGVLWLVCFGGGGVCFQTAFSASRQHVDRCFQPMVKPLHISNKPGV